MWYTILHTVGVNGISIPLGLISTLILARLLGPTGKGAYDLVLATGALLTTILGLSLPAGITYVVARGRVGLQSLNIRLVLVAVLQGVIAILLLHGMRETRYAGALLPANVDPSVIWAVGLGVVLLVLTSYWRAMLVGCQEILSVNRLDLASRTIVVGLILGAGVYSSTTGVQNSAIVFIWVYVAGMGISTSLYLRSAFSKIATSPRGLDSGFREAIRYSLPSHLSNIAQFMNYRLDLFLVGLFVGIKGVGLYALAVGLAQLLWLFSKAVAAVLLPRIAANQHAQERNAIQVVRAARLLLWASICFASAMATFAVLLLPALFGLSFRGSVTPLLLLLPGVVVFCVANILAAYFAGIGKPELNLAASSVGLFFTLALDLLLIPKFGINGAAVATSVSYTASTLLIIWMFIRHTRASVRSVLLPNKADLEFVISSVRMALVVRRPLPLGHVPNQ